jgi:tetratricopeptide (TPR) repeat protein
MKKLVWLLVPLVLGAWDPITRKQADVAQGNERLRAGKPDEAEAHYRKALGALPGAPAVLYDLGAAQVQRAQKLPKGEERAKLLESAEKSLREAGDAPDIGLRASAHYNLGNALFVDEKWKDAIEEYKKALRLEPRRDDARRNLELALARIPPPPPPQQQQQGSKDDQQKPQGGQSPEQTPEASNDPKDQKPQDQPGQSPQKEQQPEPSAKEPEPKAGQSQPQDGQAQKGQEPRPEKADANPQDSASAGEKAGDRDMDQKLNLLEDSSRNLQVQKAQQRARERRRGQPVKDW